MVLRALPETLVWGAPVRPPRRRWPTDEFAPSCGALKLNWHFCERGDPEANDMVERLQHFMERRFEPGRRFANELDFQLQLDDWPDSRPNPCVHNMLRCRPIDRLIEERTPPGRPAAAPVRTSSEPPVGGAGR